MTSRPRTAMPLSQIAIKLADFRHTASPIPTDAAQRDHPPMTSRNILLLTAVPIAALAILAGSRYAGDWSVYLLFTVAANALLFNGFRRSALFFDTFIGLFLWLGFWLKLSLRVAFTAGIFHEPVGTFDGTGAAFDRALLIASCGFAALLAASLVRERFFRYPENAASCADSGLFLLYRRFRWQCLAVFAAAVLAIAASNVLLGIYQRGMVAQTVLPFGLNGVYKWLLQFGLASVSALVIRFELEIARRLTPVAVALPLFEAFLSNVSLLSRGMVLNASALGLGGWRTAGTMRVRLHAGALALAALAFAALFAASVFAVNYLRAESLDSQSSVAVAGSMTKPLFVDRWVGIEGVLAVSSSDKLGWPLWREAWQERFQEGVLTLYDRVFIDSPYAIAGIDRSRHHFVSLPGIVAFLYYPGSAAFLFAALFAAALLAAGLEIASYRWCGRNLVLCAVFGQVIAFRYASFGYVPAQSYLLFGTLVLNGLLLFAADRACARAFAPRAVTA